MRSIHRRYIFPAMGLAAVAVGARRLNDDDMLVICVSTHHNNSISDAYDDIMQFLSYCPSEVSKSEKECLSYISTASRATAELQLSYS